MLGTGIREDEVRHVEWTSIDWAAEALTIARGEEVEQDTKDSGARIIPIGPLLLEHLKAFWEFCGRPASGLLFPRPKVGGPHVKQWTLKAIRRSGDEVGIPKLTPHALRRTFATAHFERGTSLDQIALWLGHEDPDTTFRHYILQRNRDHRLAQAGLETDYQLSPITVPIAKKKILTVSCSTVTEGATNS